MARLPMPARGEHGGDASTLPRNRVWLIDLAGLAYAITLHTFAIRDPLANGSGVQGVIDILGTVLGFVCVASACWRQKRQFATSPLMVGFALFTAFAFCSSWRSFNPVLSASKAGLLLLTLGTVYMACQAGQCRRYLLAVYRSYVGMIVLGLLVGFVLPHVFPLWELDEFSGRTRMTVWATHPGVLGEDILVLLLAAPLLGRRVGPLSQIFLVVINLLSGGKTSTALLLLAYLIRAFAGLRRWRSPRTAFTVAAASATLAVAVVLIAGVGPHLAAVDHLSQSIYGSQVSQEATSFDGRAQLWSASIGLLPTAVFLGYGLSGVREVMLTVAPWAGNSHCGYLELALASGLVGMACLVAGMWSVIQAAWSAPVRDRVYSLVLIAGIAILSIIGGVLIDPSYLGCVLLLWVYYRNQPAAAAAPAAFRERMRTRQPATDPEMRLMAR